MIEPEKCWYCDGEDPDCQFCAEDPYPCCTNRAGSGMHRHTETCITGEAS